MPRSHVIASRRSNLEQLEKRALLSVFTVINDSDAGAGSFRQAILDANASPGADTVTFNIPGTGLHTLQVASALPAITDAVVVDGFTQPGSQANTNPPGMTSNALQTIRLDGSNNPGYGQKGLNFTAGNSTVRGLYVTKFTSAGLNFASGDNYVIEGNTVVNNNTSNINVQAGRNDRVGGLTPASVNVTNGIGFGGSDSVIEGNIVTGPISVCGPNNLVGGRTAAARNVVGSAAKGGINLSSSSNRVEGNYVGTDVTGTVRMMNRRAGIFIEGDNNTIGGADPAARNVISGNERGVYIFGGANNVIQGNWIGIDATGGATMRNTAEGVLITSSDGSSGNVIKGNVISGNGEGIGLFLGTTSTTVQSNLIGTLPDGTTPAGNITAGVFIASSATDNTIGGTTAGAGNVIAYSTGSAGAGANSGPGVLVASNSVIAQRNAILGNSIFSNTGLGIDLSADQNLNADGVTPDDPMDNDGGANGLQNFPVLASASTRNGITTITGSLNSRPSSSYRIEFFVSNAESSVAEGAQFIGSIDILTDAAGNGSFKASLAGTTTPGQVVTATATDSSNNTSEFSAGTVVTKSSMTNPVARAAATGSIRLMTQNLNDETLFDELMTNSVA